MKLLSKEKLSYWGQSLVHPFDAFYEIRFRNQGSLLIAFVLLLIFGVMQCVAYQYTGYVMNMNNIEEMDALSIFVSNVSVVCLASVANWTITTLFNGKGKLKDIFVVICYSLTALIIGQVFLVFVSNFITQEEVMIVQTVYGICVVWFVFLLVAGLGTIHEYSLGKNVASMIFTVVAAAVILFIGVLLFTMIERMVSFFASLAEEALRRM